MNDQPAAAQEAPAAGHRGDQPGTGHPRVDAALRALDDLAERPVEDHAEILTDVHEQLHNTLDEHRES